MSKESLFLIDAHALCYRAFYAIKALATSQGQQTNAVYGFVNTLRKILREQKPQYLAVCFDTPAKTHRAQKYAEYKIQRPVMPDGLISQMPLIKEVVKAYRLALFECDGYEADDVIATIVKKTKDRALEVVIASEDKDIYQLAEKGVKIFNSKQDKLLDQNAISTLMGFEPKFIKDFIALAGDASDNIPGVKGIGEVSARKLIQQYGDLDSIYKHVEAIESPRLKDTLLEQKQAAFFSRDLATLSEDVPLDMSLEKMLVKEPDHAKLLELFNDLEFKKFAQEVSPSVTEDMKVYSRQLRSQAEVEKLNGQIKKQGIVALTFAGDPDPYQSLEGCYLEIYLNEKEIYKIPQDCLSYFRPVLEDNAISKVVYDIKTETKKLAALGMDIQGEIFDVMLAAYLLRPERGQASVTDLLWQYFRKSIGHEDASTVTVKGIFDLYIPLKKELKEKGLWDLFKDIEIPLALVLARMEREGVKVDEGFLKELSRDCHAKIEALTKRLYKMAGTEFNLNSPKQLSEVLFVKLNLPVVKRTKTGFSTNEEVLRQLAPQHELPAGILEYRQMAKLISTYIDTLPVLISKADGKIHATFNQTGTETGRLSSHDPNLQNIPIRTELGRQIRRAFIPSRKEYFILSADYSQIELRVLAHLSQDPHLIEAFQNDQDIHQYTASLIYDIDEKDVTKEMRDTAKRVNFGIIYGMSSFGLAKDLDIPFDQAEEFISKYFTRYPKVKEFMDSSIAQCETDGYVTTLLNRRRYILEINNPNQGMRQFAERQAINTPVQGSAADLIKLAMIRIQQALDEGKFKSAMIISVHDELVFDVVPGEIGKLSALVKDKMESALRLSVPVRVSLKKGKNWLEMEKVS